MAFPWATGVLVTIVRFHEHPKNCSSRRFKVLQMQIYDKELP
jgi:hypothetical protein